MSSQVTVCTMYKGNTTFSLMCNAAARGYGQDILCLIVLYFFNRPVKRFCFPLLSSSGSRSYASEVDQVSVIVVSRLGTSSTELEL